MPVINYDAQLAAFAEKMKDPTFAYYQSFQTIDGGRHYFGTRPPWFDQLQNQNAAPPPPHFLFSFDTIGQVIYRGIGNGRYPLRILWALGIVESGDPAISNTQTFAAAVCAPIDPEEGGEILTLADGGDVVLQDGNVVAPLDWSAEDAALLAASLAGIVVYPGDESQEPADLIVADKGAAKTNAFRGIRYIIVPDYPIRNGLPQLSAVWLAPKSDPESIAVEFSAGGS